MLTLEQFVATRRRVENLSTEDCGADDSEGPGYIYADYCHIVIGEGTKCYLTIANQQWESDGDLGLLERILYYEFYVESVG